MKKTILLALIGFGAFSCAKERTCTCTQTDVTTTTAAGLSTTSTTKDVVSTTYGKIKKSEARQFGNCLDQTSTNVSTGGGFTFSTVSTMSDCEVK